MKTKIVLMILAVAFAGATNGAAGEVAGVLSPMPVEAQSYIAVRVDLPDSIPVGGIRWYNNDVATVFPSVLLAAAEEDGGPDLDTTLQIGEDVLGVALGWSELLLEIPVTNDVGEMFAVFQLPPFEGAVAPGVGPGIGYGFADQTPEIYLSSDGTDWMQVGAGVALLYETVPAVGKSAGAGILFQKDQAPVLTTSLSRPQPNPFNPRTELAFTLAADGRASLMVYNLRGQKVATLVDEDLEAGPHTAVWEGGFDSGGRASSGVYLARLQAGGTLHQQRLVLLK